MSDLDQDGSLDFAEFCIAMHLVVGVSRRNLAMPPHLPPALIPTAKAHLVPAAAVTVPTPSIPEPAHAPEPVAQVPPPAKPSDAHQHERLSLDAAFSDLMPEIHDAPLTIAGHVDPPAPVPVVAPVEHAPIVQSHVDPYAATATFKAPVPVVAQPAVVPIVVATPAPAPVSVQPQAPAVTTQLPLQPTASVPASTASFPPPRSPASQTRSLVTPPVTVAPPVAPAVQQSVVIPVGITQAPANVSKAANELKAVSAELAAVQVQLWRVALGCSLPPIIAVTVWMCRPRQPQLRMTS